MENFGIFAEKYDIYNSADYDAYASFVKVCFAQSFVPVKEVLDLGCGTGELSVRLADMGYSVTSSDISEDMLSVLINKIGSRDILPVKQDMRELDLFGTVQGCVSSFDCLNYLKTAADVEKAISKVGFFMEKGGIFVFDVNTDHTYKNVYDGRSYVYEDDDSLLVWRSEYNERQKICRFWLTSFTNDGDGSYTREDEVHTQKNHSPRTLKKAIEKAGFDIVGVYGSTDFRILGDEDTKAYYVLRKNRSL